MSNIVISRNNFNAGELSPLLSARGDQQRYASGCSRLHNMVVYPHGAAVRRSGMRYLGNAAKKDGAVRLIPFIFSEEQAYVLEFTNNYLQIWKDGGCICNEDGNPMLLETPWQGDSLRSLQYCQSADVLYLVCQDDAPRKLERHGHDNWVLLPLTFGAKMPAPQNVKGSATGTATRKYSYVITAVAKDGGEESLPSAPCTVTGAAALNVSDMISLHWDAVAGAERYHIYKALSGSESYGYIGRAGAGEQFDDRGAEPDFGQGPPDARNPFASENDYPACVQFYQQRLCFAGTKNRPQTIWCSQSANYESMNVSAPLRDDDAVTVTIAADRVNRIRWMMPARRLLVGTVGGEWQLAGAGDTPLSPANGELRRDTMHGSAPIMPLAIGQSVLFVQRDGKTVREFRYTLESDGYNAGNVSILAEHLLRDAHIVAWCYQQSPASIVWCLLSNGTLAAMTYLREHDVVGWHSHKTDGFIESLCVIPSSPNNSSDSMGNTETASDEVWLVVRRKRFVHHEDGEDTEEEIRCMERLDPFMRSNRNEDAFFVDSGLSLISQTPVTTISGLEHLEGREVQILCDGSVHPSRVVQNGAVTLERPAKHIHAGLGFISELSPTSLETGLENGSSLGRLRRISRLRVRLLQSLGLQYGTNVNNLREVLFRPAHYTLGASISLFSGEKDLPQEGGFDGTAPILLRQADPLPLIILAVTAELEFGSW